MPTPNINVLFSSLLFVCVWWFYLLVCVCTVCAATCSATEGADSAPVSGAGTPSEEKVGQVGMGESIVFFFIFF